MDVAHPIRVVVPTLDGQVLEVLARTARPMTGREVARLVGARSVSGVHRVLVRLTEQGIVLAEEYGPARLYTANRDHLAWPAVEVLAAMRRTLLERLAAEIEAWQTKPLHASLFGSAARGDGDAQSGIDVLLIRPDGVDEDESPWADQVDALRRRVRKWTGNTCRPFQVDTARLNDYVDSGDRLVQEWLSDSVTLSGSPLKSLVKPLRVRK